MPNRRHLPTFMAPLFDAAEQGANIVVAVDQIAKDLGFDSFSYAGSVLPSPKPAGNLMYHGWASVTPEWLIRYAEKVYASADPRIYRMWESYVPQMWDNTSERGLSQRIDQFLDDAMDYGVGSGVTMGFVTTLGARALFALNHRRADITSSVQERWAKRVGEFYLLGSMVHSLYQIIEVEGSTRMPRMGDPVTLFEAEVLRAASAGGSLAQLAERLDLSAESVRRSLRSVYAKLGAKNRAEALQLVHCGLTADRR